MPGNGSICCINLLLSSIYLKKARSLLRFRRNNKIVLPSRIKFFLLGNIKVEAIGYSIVQVLRPWNILATVILLLYGTFLIGSTLLIYLYNIDRKIMFIYIGSRHHFTYFQPCVYRIELARVWKMEEKRYYMPKVNSQIAPKRGNGYIIGRFSIVTKERRRKNGRKNLMRVCMDHHLPFWLGAIDTNREVPLLWLFLNSLRVCRWCLRL